MNYLLDTNTVINYLDASLPIDGMKFMNKIIDEESMISIVTKIETLGFNFSSMEDQNVMETFIDGSTIFELTNEIVSHTIAIRKKYKIKIPDAIIAATALVYDLTILTRNNKDFKVIHDVKTLNPFEI